MMKYRFFLLLLVTSCHGVSSVYRYDHAEDQRNQDSDTYRFRQDEYDFNEKALERFEDWYCNLIDQLGHFVDPTIIILDVYDYAAKRGQLPFLGPTGKRAAYKASKVWKRGKQVFGREEGLFSHDRKGLEIIRFSCKPIPQEYQKSCLSMVFRLVDRLFRERPKYKKLSQQFTDLHQTFTERFTHLSTAYPERCSGLEQPLSQEDQQAYSHAMAYLEKLFMEHSDAMNKSANLLFYSDTYPGFLFFLLRNDLHLCPFPVLYLLAISSGSGVLVNEFLGFCEQQGMNVKHADGLAKSMFQHASHGLVLSNLSKPSKVRLMKSELDRKKAG
ncbi:hypothetical protein [Cardinium endosymbiont of Sogatella furcifera]|uniref:hypothetical protein n=1 Tax=Cardinium endosymbiont of Sogatella furcifera TaxID=650378 RepID=UPI0013B45020|nr:hypothetical protein [Cardinium endosymbiont of Sogatella furcifera]